jgi:hypothetical protein
MARQVTFKHFQFNLSILFGSVIGRHAALHTKPFSKLRIPPDFRVFHFAPLLNPEFPF